MSHRMREASGPFADAHRALMGAPVDFSAFDPSAFPPALVEQARQVWGERVRTEFRSTQIFTRLLADILDAGDPLDTYAAFHDFVGDEIRHVALCAGLLRALGGEPRFPDPVPLPRSEAAQRAPAAERALNTAITMLGINETLSVGFIEDLHARCTEPTVHAVLHATVADEDEHQDLGWSYVAKSLGRFPPSTRPAWRDLAAQALTPHRQWLARTLDALPPAQRHLDAWPDEERVTLGLFSQARQALVMKRTLEDRLLPRLRALDLA